MTDTQTASSDKILGGRKEKIRAGDMPGALTKDLGYTAAQVGKIKGRSVKARGL